MIEVLMRLLTLRILLALVLGAALLYGCGAAPEAACQEQVRAYTQQLSPLTAQWGTAVQRASSSPRSNLSPAIASMRAIRQQTDGVSVPECAKNAQSLLTRSMDMQIQGFQDTMAGKPSTTVQQEFSNAAQLFADFEHEIRRLAGANL
jgi:hypothetical protein